jgi:hypothetical protein
MQKYPSKLLSSLAIFLPTWFGAAVSASLMVVTIIIHQFASIRSTVGIPGGINLQKMASSGLDGIVTLIFGQSHINTAVVALFWAMVGVFVYILVLGITGGLRELSSGIEERTYLWPQGANPHSPLKGFLERFGFHALGLIIVALYIFLPLAIVLRGPVLPASSLANSQLAMYTVWFVLGTITLHGLTVVLRFLFLRNRLLS